MVHISEALCGEHDVGRSLYVVVVDDGAGAGGMVALAPALGKLAALASLDLSGTSVVMECVVAASTLPVCYSVVMCVAVAVAVAVVVCMYGCVRAAVCGARTNLRKGL